MKRFPLFSLHSFAPSFLFLPTHPNIPNHHPSSLSIIIIIIIIIILLLLLLGYYYTTNQLPMYSSSSSSSQQQQSSSSNPNPNLIRYDSAPSSLLSSMVDSVVGDMDYHHHQHHHHHHQQQQQHQFLPSNNNASSGDSSRTHNTLPLLHQGPYGNFTKPSSSNNNPQPHGIDSSPNNNNNNNNNNSKTTSSSHLIRHSSSPAGLLSHLASDIGYTSSKGFDVNYNPQGSSIGHDHMLSRLGSQLSFTRKDHHSLSQISEVNESMLETMASHDNERKRSVASRPSSTGFSLTAWDDNNDNNFIISSSSSKRGKAVCDDYLTGLSGIDSQQAMALEMATMERLMQVPHDSVPCKIRAKRGFATHPRSIAERERRTRISGKLKKLQELVPNMDKQTSYSDMLDLAVQHIKGLQGHIEKLNHELDHCTCGCKPESKQP